MTGDKPTTVEIIGGEMHSWSESSSGTGGPALAELLRTLARPGASVLLAGPHEAEVVTAVPECRVTLLLRGLDDARAAVAAYPGVRVLSGSVVKMAQETFDVVFAADGLRRLVSAEGVQAGWAETFDALASAVAPGGTLLVGVENPLGVHRLVEFAPAEGAGTDSAWTPTRPADDSVPASPEQLRSAMSRVGFSGGSVYAAYPTPRMPFVVAEDGFVGALPEGTSAAACRAIPGPVLSDPRRIAADAARAGLAAALAPAWFAVATRPADEVSAAPIGGALLADLGVRPELQVISRLTRAADGTAHRVPVRAGGRAYPGSGSAPLRSGLVTRDPAALVGTVPCGRLLSEVLLGYALRRDLPALREELAGFAAWLSRQGERAVFATMDQVTVTADGDYELLDPSWTWSEPIAPELALTMVLRQFAVMMITDGHPHAWPANIDADGITIALAAMAGHDIDRHLVTDAVMLAASVATEVEGLSPEQVLEIREALATAGTGSAPLTVDSHRELRIAAEAGREEVIRLRAVLQRTEDWLADCERKLRDAHRQVKALRESRAYRLGAKIAGPARSVRKLLGGR